MDVNNKLSDVCHKYIKDGKFGALVFQTFVKEPRECSLVDLLQFSQLRPFFPEYISKDRPQSKPYLISYIKFIINKIHLNSDIPEIVNTLELIKNKLSSKYLIGLTNFLIKNLSPIPEIIDYSSQTLDNDMLYDNILAIYTNHRPYFAPVLHYLCRNIDQGEWNHIINQSNIEANTFIRNICTFFSMNYLPNAEDNKKLYPIINYDLSHQIKDINHLRYIYHISDFVNNLYLKDIIELYSSKILDNAEKVGLEIIFGLNILYNTLLQIGKYINVFYWDDATLEITAFESLLCIIRRSNPWENSAHEIGICNITMEKYRQVHKLLKMKKGSWDISSAMAKSKIIKDIVFDWATSKKLDKWSLFNSIEYNSLFYELMHYNTSNILTRLSTGNNEITSMNDLSSKELMSLFNVYLSPNNKFGTILSTLQSKNNDTGFYVPLVGEYDQDAEDLMMNLLRESTVIVYGIPHPKTSRISSLKLNIDWTGAGIRNTSYDDANLTVTDIYTCFTSNKKPAKPHDYGKNFTVKELGYLYDVTDFLIAHIKNPSEVEDYDYIVKLRRECTSMIEIMRRGYNNIISVFENLNKEDKTRFRDALYSLFYGGMYCRRWKGPGYPYPLNVKDTEILVDPDDNVIKELSKTMEYMENNGEKIIAALPMYNYTATLEADSACKMNEFLRLILDGRYCIRMASTILIGTSIYALYILFAEEPIPIKTKVAHIY